MISSKLAGLQQIYWRLRFYLNDLRQVYITSTIEKFLIQGNFYEHSTNKFKAISTNIVFNINTIFSCPGIAGKVYILEPGLQSYSK